MFFIYNMSLKKGRAKTPGKKAGAKRAAVKKPKIFQEIILHEEWPQTESLIRSEEKHGVILDPDRELAAKPEFTEITEVGQSNKLEVQAWWVPAVAIFVRLSGWLLVPLIIGTTLGKWLDSKYDTAPWLFLATIGVAFIVSMFGLIKNAMEEFKKIEKAANNNNGTNSVGKNK